MKKYIKHNLYNGNLHQIPTIPFSGIMIKKLTRYWEVYKLNTNTYGELLLALIFFIF